MRTAMTILGAATLALAAGCAGRFFGAGAEPIVLRGQVTYPQRIALPPDARARVVLLDISGTESETVPVTTAVIPEAGQVPIDFRLAIPPQIVDPDRKYALRASITSGDGRLLWSMPESVPVQPASVSGPVTLRVHRAGTAKRNRRDRYACPGLSIAVDAGVEQATVKFPDAERTLPRVRSASGAKYAGNGTVFWSKGRTDALVEYQGRTYRDCVATSTMRGIGPHIAAHGNEPYWSARVLGAEGAGGIQFALGVTEPEVIRAPSASVGHVDEGATTVYRGQGNDESIRIRVRESQCADSMSGETFPLTVRVATDNRELRGCGRRIGR